MAVVLRDGRGSQQAVTTAGCHSPPRWRLSFGSAEDRNSGMCAWAYQPALWRSPCVAAEDRNSLENQPIDTPNLEWRSPFEAAEGRNTLSYRKAAEMAG
ncbi:hypothetical protein OG462_34430 [Streptomyces sp. NBC_01077]|uniref:hypothetical protein n=1 Tax=Streptomyces sp. NBC_01077 TaxID=2903746 RepID=UPI00386651EC|nr:hypothetical protein OG462_34430 [Streptomyces sp. NBC_01077]